MEADTQLEFMQTKREKIFLGKKQNKSIFKGSHQIIGLLKIYRHRWRQIGVERERKKGRSRVLYPPKDDHFKMISCSCASECIL